MQKILIYLFKIKNSSEHLIFFNQKIIVLVVAITNILKYQIQEVCFNKEKLYQLENNDHQAKIISLNIL
jgi:hypothetical protein